MSFPSRVAIKRAATIRLSIKSTATELLILSTAVGLLATFAAPWMELRGTYAAWRITEWHTFWHGATPFLLSDVVAASYQVPIEFATTGMQHTVPRLFIVGAVLGMWHSAVFLALVFAGARRRWRGPSAKWRVAAQVVVLVAASSLALYFFSLFCTLPSSLTPKVDFRTQSDIHVDSLIWSSLNVFPVSPLLAMGAVLVQLGALLWTVRKRSTSSIE